MGTYTNIPESPLAEILSIGIGQTAGIISSAAIKAIDALQKKVDKLCDAISKGDVSKYAELESIEAVIEAIKATFNALDAVLAALEATLKIIEIPIKALDIALKIIKLLPIPVPPPITVTLIMLSELIAQISEIIMSLRATISSIRAIFDPIKAMLDRIKRNITSLRVSEAIDLACSPDSGLLSDKDKATLVGLGVLDSNGNNIFSKLGPAAGNDNDSLIGFGTDIDLNDVLLSNLIKGADGQLELEDNTGDSLVDVYKTSKDKPSKPTSDTYPPEGWSISGTGDNLWKSTGTKSGKTGKVSGWTDPELTDGASEPIESDKDKTTLQVIIANSNTDLGNLPQPCVLITDSDSAYGMMSNLVDKIDKSSISDELKDTLKDIIGADDLNDTGETTEDGLGILYYLDKSTGRIYTLKITIDPDSPKIAKLRYVVATDDNGNIRYTGGKTFATKDSILLEEAKVKLIQLLT